MKVIFIYLFLVIASFESSANIAQSFNRAVFLECNNCQSISDFKKHSMSHFENNFRGDHNKSYAYTIVNHNSRKAVFIDLKNYYRIDPESGTVLDVVIPTLLTTDSEMEDDYNLSSYVVGAKEVSTASSSLNLNDRHSKYDISYTFFDKPKPKVATVHINRSIHSLSYGVKEIASQISQGLNSHVTLASGWHKLAGRAVIIVTFNDGALGAFFKCLYCTDMYSYLEGTAIDSNGNIVNIPGAINPSNGQSGGVTTIGSGSWSIISSGVLACTSIKGGTPVCEWIKY